MKIYAYFIIILFVSSVVLADFTVNPSSNDFGNVDQGSSLSQILTIENTGTNTINLAFQASTLQGPNNYSVTFTTSDNTTLDAGDSRDFTLTATLPSIVWSGVYTGELVIVDSDSNQETFDYGLEINPVADIQVSGSQNFGDVFVNQTKEIKFTIKNSGNTILTNVRPIALDPNLGLTLQPSAIERINPGESAEITAKIFVPYSQTVQDDLKIGSLRVDSDQKSMSFGDFTVNIISYLKIDKVRVEVANEAGNYRNGETIADKAKPRDLIEFEIDVENVYDTSAAGNHEFEIDDVELTITVFEIDEDFEDIELKSDSVSLDYEGNDEKRTFLLSFVVPDTTPDSSYDIEIKANGEDENNNDLEDIVNLVLEVDRDTHDLQIDNFNLDPSTIDCNENTIAELEFINLGTDDEDYVRYTIQNSDLGINEVKTRFEISSDFEDEENIYSEDIQLDIDNPEEGTYPIELRLYRDFDILEDILTKNLVIKDCSTQQQEETQEQPTTQPQVQPSQEQETNEEQEIIEETSEEEEQAQEEQEAKPLTLLPRILPGVQIAASGAVVGIPTIPSNFRESNSYTFLLLLAYLFIILILLVFVLIIKRR